MTSSKEADAVLMTAMENMEQAVKSLQSIAYTQEPTEDGYKLHATDMHVLINPIMRKLGMVQRMLILASDEDQQSAPTRERLRILMEDSHA